VAGAGAVTLYANGKASTYVTGATVEGLPG
jgi:hypothetical protein